MKHMEDIRYNLMSLVKTIAFGLWAVLVIGLQYNHISDKGAFTAGAVSALLVFAVPVLVMKIVRGVAGFVTRRRNAADADEAVSPVIAVILMVAITVVLAAVVYVWVSDFGAGNTEMPGSLALSQNSRVGSNYTYVVTSASSLLWTEVRVIVEQEYQYGNSTRQWCAMRDNACIEPADEPVRAGDILAVYGTPGRGTMRVIDTSSNSLLVQMTLG